MINKCLKVCKTFCFLPLKSQLKNRGHLNYFVSWPRTCCRPWSPSASPPRSRRWWTCSARSRRKAGSFSQISASSVSESFESLTRRISDKSCSRYNTFAAAVVFWFWMMLCIQNICGTEPHPSKFRAKKYKIAEKSFGLSDFRQMMSHLPEHVPDHEIIEMFSFADKDRDGRISYDEFLVSDVNLLLLIMTLLF